MVEFTDYDRITDTLLFINENITLNFTVALSYKNKSGGRQFYHLETAYTSKYIGTDSARSIKRHMRYYFVIDNKRDFGNGLILRPQDVVILLQLIEEQFLPLFFSSKRVFKIIDDKLTIPGRIKSVVYTQSDYKSLSLTPIVIETEGGFKEGVKFKCNLDYVEIDIDRFMGFYYILKNTDMYGAACSLTAYAKSGPYGINVWTPSSTVGLGGGGKAPEFEEPIMERKNSNRFLDSK